MICKLCDKYLIEYPNCQHFEHWEVYCVFLQGQLFKQKEKAIEEKRKADILDLKLDMRDENRDKLDVAEEISNLEKTTSYSCSGCGKDYILPTHLDHFTCVCGQRCRLRHIGGINPIEDVLDAARNHFGNERQAQLSYIAEIIGGEYCLNYDADRIRKMIREELNRWQLIDGIGWQRKNKI